MSEENICGNQKEELAMAAMFFTRSRQMWNICRGPHKHTYKVPTEHVVLQDIKQNEKYYH